MADARLREIAGCVRLCLQPDPRVRHGKPLTQDSTGRFWALYGTGTRFAVYPALSADGLQLGHPTELDLGTEQLRYSGLAIAVPRAGVPLDDIVDGDFPSGYAGDRWAYYFRLRLR